MADFPIYLLSLCSGTAMLDEGVCLALPGSRVVAYVERETGAAAILLARMADAAVVPAPVWCGNLEAFDAGQWHEAVDGITAGFPCQPWSAAGKREGTADIRWIWPSIAEIIRAAQPEFVFLENVPGLAVGLGLNRVLGDLAEMGFDAEWCHIAASDVGAAHQRERIFILAIRPGGRFGELWQSSRWCRRFANWRDENIADTEGHRRWKQEPQRGSERRTPVDGTSGTVADATRADGGKQRPRRQRIFDTGTELADTNRGQRKQQCRPVEEPNGRLFGSDGGGEHLANSESEGSQRIARQSSASGWKIETGPTGCDGGTGIFAPGPASPDWRSIIAEQPWLAPAIESGICGVVDGNAVVVDESRADQLRAIGNGVVALQAAAAFIILARRITSTK